MKTNRSVKKSILLITRTGVLLALLVATQVIGRSLPQLITGSAVNLILITAALAAGLVPGLTVAMISPVLAKFFGIGPLWELVPVIAAGNAVLVLIFSLMLGRAKNLSGAKKYLLWVVSVVTAAAAKFLTIWLGVVKIVLPLLSGLKPAQIEKISAMFSFPQLFTALIGGGLAMLIIPTVQAAVRKNR